MSRAALPLLLLVLVGLPLSGAAAKSEKPSTPKLERTTPMRVSVGTTVTLRGSGFSMSRKRNTVLFRSPGRRYAFARPVRASHTKLVVRVPATVERLLSRADGLCPPARFKIRVIVKRRRSKLTGVRISPVFVSSLDKVCGSTG